MLYKTPFTRYNRLSSRLYNQFDNRLYRVNTVVKRVWQPVWQPCWTNSCSFKRLSNRVAQPLWQRVWQPVVSCIQTFTRLWNRLDNRFDNRLYRVNGAFDRTSNRLLSTQPLLITHLNIHPTSLKTGWSNREMFMYIGWSDVTVMWSHYDLYVVGQQGVLCEVKWKRFVALFE